MVRNVLAWIVALTLGSLLIGCSDSSDSTPSPAPQPERLPIVFVHGQLGSAQQFETQAMRFTSNGYPQELLFAFEYDTNQDVNPLEDLDAFLDGVLAETGASQVYAIGHSRGTSVWTEYLEAPSFDGPARVDCAVRVIPDGGQTSCVATLQGGRSSEFIVRRRGGDHRLYPAGTEVP